MTKADTDGFTRSDIAKVSYFTLMTKLKDADKTLVDKLVEAGYITQELADNL